MILKLTERQIRLIEFALEAINQDAGDYLEGSEWKPADLYRLMDSVMRQKTKQQE